MEDRWEVQKRLARFFLLQYLLAKVKLSSNHSRHGSWLMGLKELDHCVQLVWKCKSRCFYRISHHMIGTRRKFSILPTIAATVKISGNMSSCLKHWKNVDSLVWRESAENRLKRPDWGGAWVSLRRRLISFGLFLNLDWSLSSKMVPYHVSHQLGPPLVPRYHFELTSVFGCLKGQSQARTIPHAITKPAPSL